MHNEYCKNHSVSGIIPQIREKGGFKGLFDTSRGLVYQSNWSPRYNKSDKVIYPWQAAMDHDKSYGTYYSFFSDQEFTEKDLRDLYKLRGESSFIYDLAEYAWKKYIFGNEQINTVLLRRCDNGTDVTVKCTFIAKLLHK